MAMYVDEGGKTYSKDGIIKRIFLKEFKVFCEALYDFLNSVEVEVVDYQEHDLVRDDKMDTVKISLSRENRKKIFKKYNINEKDFDFFLMISKEVIEKAFTVSRRVQDSAPFKSFLSKYTKQIFEDIGEIDFANLSGLGLLDEGVIQVFHLFFSSFNIPIYDKKKENILFDLIIYNELLEFMTHEGNNLNSLVAIRGSYKVLRDKVGKEDGDDLLKDRFMKIKESLFDFAEIFPKKVKSSDEMRKLHLLDRVEKRSSKFIISISSFLLEVGDASLIKKAVFDLIAIRRKMLGSLKEYLVDVSKKDFRSRNVEDIKKTVSAFIIKGYKRFFEKMEGILDENLPVEFIEFIRLNNSEDLLYSTLDGTRGEIVELRRLKAESEKEGRLKAQERRRLEVQRKRELASRRVEEAEEKAVAKRVVIEKVRAEKAQVREDAIKLEQEREETVRLEQERVAKEESVAKYEAKISIQQEEVLERVISDASYLSLGREKFKNYNVTKSKKGVCREYYGDGLSGIKIDIIGKRGKGVELKISLLEPKTIIRGMFRTFSPKKEGSLMERLGISLISPHGTVEVKDENGDRGVYGVDVNFNHIFKESLHLGDEREGYIKREYLVGKDKGVYLYREQTGDCFNVEIYFPDRYDSSIISIDGDFSVLPGIDDSVEREESKKHDLLDRLGLDDYPNDMEVIYRNGKVFLEELILIVVCLKEDYIIHMQIIMRRMIIGLM